MTFDEALEKVRELLQRQGRASYPALKLRFGLDEAYLEALKAELIDAERVAADEDGKVLVWTGGLAVPSSESQEPSVESSVPRFSQSLTLESKPPISYTPAHLADRIRAVTVSDGERKTITALFADLKGSTALIEGLDPEEARTVIDPALQLMMDAVHQYDGFVAQALGDGIFALFGAPIAHEDHPQRAVYAALRMQDSMRRYGETLRAKGYPPLLMRVGLNTGEVVLRSIRKDDLHADYVPVGHSTNLAARMEQLATPGTIVVSAYTHRLADGYFAFKDLGLTQIKGVEEPLHIYEVLGVGQLRTRLQVSASRYGLTRFVGRQNEMEHLHQALTHAKAGHGQIVGTMGEPGLGKSRLVREFVGTIHESPLLVLEAYSVSHGKATAYLPVIELLKSYFRIEAQGDERSRREKVNGKVLTLDRSLEDTLSYLFALLGIEEQPSPLAQMDPQIRRRRTFEALKKLFLRESFKQPLVLIFEDLHWIDGETQGFLDVLGESVASAKILLLTTYRPEYRHEWGQKAYYTQLRLAPLGREEAEEFLDALLGTPVGANNYSPLYALKQLILDKTQGTPFFMEEIVQELREQGVLPVGATGRSPLPTDLHIPPTVQGILAARIDRLAPDEKALVQQLAVIGRQFPLSLIRQVIAQPEADLYRLLASLQDKEFLYEQQAFPEREYIFKHALTQEVAYGTVLQEQRKLLHERTGQAIEALYSTKLEDHYSALAHHYSRSGNAAKAVEYLTLAGQQAVQRSANQEAISHLIKGLELLSILPDTTERAQEELILQSLLGQVFMAAKGYAAPEVEKAFTRARDLCRQIGDSPQLFPVLWGLWAFYLDRAEHQTAQQLGEELLTIAQRQQDPTLLVGAHRALGESLEWLGELTAARAHLQQGIALANPQHLQSRALFIGQSPDLDCLSRIAPVRWQLGYPDQALRQCREVLSLARALAHPHSLASCLGWGTMLFQLCREREETLRHADEAVTLCTEQGLPFWLSMATILRGWALAELRDREEGIGQLRAGLAAWQAAGSEIVQPYWLTLLAEACGKTGEFAEGLKLLNESLVLINKTGERFYQAEVYRIQGQLILEAPVQGQEGRIRKAEECFLKAIAIAQKQQAKSLELRAVMSLAQLWQSQGKRAEARQWLAEIYGWFTEGFDTKDLQEAKALLQELV